MKTVKLLDFLDRDAGRSQSSVAGQLGVNQSAVSKMVRVKRDVILLVDGTGSVRDAYEIRRIGKFAQ